IEEIVVTAQKREQAIQDVPISITALPGDFVAEAGIDNAHEIAKFTPNVNFATNPCCPIIYIRGFGTSFNASSFDPTVGYAIDDLSISQSIYFADPLYDIERIEVLRGPQGTLFGKNTTGGLFNITTAAPTKEFTGFLTGRVGGLGVHRFEAALGGPLGSLGDWAQFRFAVLEAQEAGDVENTLLGTRQPRAAQQAARLKLALQPVDGLDVLFIASRMQTDARAFQFQQHELRDSSVQLLRRYDPAFDDDGLNHKNSVNRLTLTERDTDLIQGNLRYDLGDLGPLHDAEVVAVLGYTGFDASAPIDFDFSPADVAYFKTPAPILYDQSSAELRFSGVVPAPLAFGELELLAGALFFESSFVSDVPVVAGEDFEEFLLSAPGFELATGQPAVGGVGF
ncbi:MAG: TonB-dependent receptor, partial [Candidatus Binatia bacterium]